MEKTEALHKLRAHEADLKAFGILSLSIFGSTARGDAGQDSDVDIVVRLDDRFSTGGFQYFGRLEALDRKLRAILGRPVDIVTEPVRKNRLRHHIEEDQVRAF